MTESTPNSESSGPARAPTPDEMELFVQLGSARDFALGCRELIDVADDLAARADARSPVEVADAAARAAGTPPSVQRQVRDAFALLEKRTEEVVTTVVDGDPINPEEWTADPFAAFARYFQPDALVAQFADLVRTQFAGLPGVESYLVTYGEATLRRPRQPLLLRALLATICSHVEVSIVRVLRRDLLTHGTYRSMSDPELETELSQLMKGGLGKWQTTLRERAGVDIAAGCADWSLVHELFERRHVLVHRDGLVDHHYRKKVPNAPALRTSLAPTSEYMREAVDLCETVTVGLMTSLLRRVRPDLARELSYITCRWGDEAGDEGRWLCAEGYHRQSGTLANDPADVERRRVECWLDRQERLGSDAVHDDVESWDTKDLGQEFSLARLILLREDEAGLRLLTQLRASGVVSDQDVRGWRLFRWWREQGLVF